MLNCIRITFNYLINILCLISLNNLLTTVCQNTELEINKLDAGNTKYVDVGFIYEI